MPRSKTEVLTELAEDWRRGDLDAIRRNVDPDVEVDATVRVLNPAVYRGYDGLIEFGEEVDELWEITDSEVHRVLESDDEALVILTNTMRARGSGVELAEPVAHRYLFRGDRVLRMTLLTDVKRAIADFEAGRSPQPVL